MSSNGDGGVKGHSGAANGCVTTIHDGKGSGKDNYSHTNAKQVDDSPVSNSSRQGFFSKISGAIVWGLENSFFRVGYFVGEYPVVSIVFSAILCGLCGLGMKTFEPSPEQETLWVPSAARVINEKKWMNAAFPKETRYVSVLLVQHGNILTPTSLNALMDIYKESYSISVNGITYPDMCVRLGPYCYVSSILELWYYNEAVIRNLTALDIVHAINNTKTTPISGVEVSTLLGGEFKYDTDGSLVEAQAAQITWIMKKENVNAELFESRMIKLVQQGQKEISSEYVYATRSFDDEGYGAVNSDTQILTAGFSIVFVFLILSLGKFNLMEQKVYLSISGMVCVGLSVLVSYGVATALSIIYSPIQSILPFLLLGIGVDDMFVVVEVWKNLTPEEDQLSIPSKVGTTLSRAGVSITVTSITDLVAFGIGATTVIPALSSFCIYAAIGILALFFLVSTFFTGVLALDERRRRQRRDGCVCCYVHPDSYSPNSCSQGRSMLQTFFTRFYGPLLMKKPVKVFVIFIALAASSLALWRFVEMKRDFDLVKYIPSDSYAYKYARTKEQYFDREGIDSTVYCGAFDYWKYSSNMNLMYTKLSQSEYIQPGTIVAWFNAFNQLGGNYTTEAEYNHQVFQFLQTPIGSRFSSFVKFNSTQEPVSIIASKFTLTHVRQSNSDGEISSMDNIRDIIDSSGFPSFSGADKPSTKCFAYAREYLTLETIKVLVFELYRNLGLAAAAVLLVTIVLVANVRTSLMVFVCVLFTVVDVGGLLEVWDTTIDTASSILLTVSMGLAVDYSAHVGHTFMTVQGHDRDERAIQTLQKIGPAVFNGGFSTMLAFVLLVQSASYGFQLFFRVFMSVVLFGMFHGLTFLPVLLSILGPPPYDQTHHTTHESTLVVTTQPVDQSDEAASPPDANSQKCSEPLIRTSDV